MVGFWIIGILLTIALGVIAYLLMRVRHWKRGISRESIIDILREYHYPHRIDNDGDIIFNIGRDAYLIKYNAPRVELSYSFVMEGDEEQIRTAAARVSEGIIMAKIYVNKLANSGVGVHVTLDSFCFYNEDLRLSLYQYIDVINEALGRLQREYDALRFGFSLADADASRREDIYEREYRMLPSVIEDVRSGVAPAGLLSSREHLYDLFTHDMTNGDSIKEWKTFKILRDDRYGDYEFVLYQFPEPKVVPEAKYGAILLNTKTRDVDYYTLELSFDNKWVYGKTTADSHLNFGEAESGDLETFVDWVFSNNKHVIATSRHTTPSGTVS